MKEIIDIIENKGTNQGYCKLCKETFKRGDYMIMVEKGEINQIKYLKICSKCYLKQLANKMGWKKLNELMLKMQEEKI